MKKFKLNRRLLVAGVVIFVAGTVSSWYFYTKVNNPAAASKAEAEAVVAKVGKLILLPKDETPTVATVNDPSKLTGQAFFINAQKGDFLVLYTTAKRAILYRPAANLLINVSTLTINDNNVAGAQTDSQITFDLRNGTKIASLAAAFVSRLMKKLPTAKVLTEGNTKSDYKESLLIDNTPGGNRGSAGVSAALGIASGKLPAGEATSAAQFTIILGQDQK